MFLPLFTTHHPRTLTCSVLSLSPPTPSLPPSIPPPRRPSVITRGPPRNTRCIRFHLDALHQHPPAQPQTIPNPPSSKPAPFPKNQPVASTRPPVQVLHAAFRPDSVLLSLLASLVLPWHAAQRTHSFLLYIILPGTRQPTRASYKLTDADCSASAACVCVVLCVCVRVCVRACACERESKSVCVIARECGGFLSTPLPRFSSPSPSLPTAVFVASGGSAPGQDQDCGGDNRHLERTRHFLAVRPPCLLNYHLSTPTLAHRPGRSTAPTEPDRHDTNNTTQPARA